MPDPVLRLNAALEGRYRTLRQLGEGGMATVWLADDLRHGRKVALKVLKPELAAVIGAERFLAEIRTTANLQHPHILPLFDSGEADGFLFYVMPYVDGESLRTRMDRQGPLPVDQAVGIATQVAQALQYAHEHRVVHRDVKPANILLHAGEALVADFGIALAVDTGNARLTQTGVSLGTPLYMSPEQATGESEVGPASDVWSLGAVLYEMLAGEPPYSGSTPHAILGRIVSGPADPVTKRRRTTPANVAAALAKALETTAADRFQTAGDFAQALRDPGFRHGEPARRRSLATVAGAGVAVYLLGVLTWSVLGPDRREMEAGEPIRFIVPGLTAGAVGRGLALSPDGTTLAYAGGGGLSVRRVTDFESSRDLTQSNALQPFFSPDGEALAYFEGIAQSLMRVSSSGGAPRVVAEGSGARALGGSWAEDGTIVFATTTGVYRVPADGGVEPSLVREPDPARGELYLSWPQVLPGGRAALLTVVPRTAVTDGDASIAVLDLESGGLTEVLAGGSGARYASSGHLVYSADGGTLHAAAFDLGARRIRGERVALPVEGLAQVRGMGADFDLSPTGTLVYLLRSREPATLAWVGRDGREEPLSAPARNYSYPRVSPDGKRVAVDIAIPGGQRNIHVWDVERSVEIPVTDDPGEEFAVEWSPRGDSLYFSSNQGGGTFQVYRSSADGSGDPELVFSSESLQLPQGVTPGGDRIVLSESRPGADQFDLTALVLGEPVRHEPVLSTPGVEYNASLSRDGRFVAYQTYESGRAEVYVRPLEGASRALFKVSANGGEKPVWSRTGDTLFYRSPADSLMAVPVEMDPGFSFQPAVPLFEMRLGSGFGFVSGRHWDVSPVDGRFLIVRPSPPGATGARVVLNWTGELRRLVEQGGAP